MTDQDQPGEPLEKPGETGDEEPVRLLLRPTVATNICDQPGGPHILTTVSPSHLLEGLESVDQILAKIRQPGRFWIYVRFKGTGSGSQEDTITGYVQAAHVRLEGEDPSAFHSTPTGAPGSSQGRPVWAKVVQNTFIYQRPNRGSGLVLEVRAGDSVEVIELESLQPGFSGHWVKVRTIKGTEGHIPINAVSLEQQTTSLNRQSYPASSHMLQSHATYGNPFFDVGELVEFWSDIIEGEAAKASRFQEVYAELIHQRQIPGVAAVPRSLSAPGLWAQSRQFHVIKRDVATGAVYIAPLGNDLFVSWRLFVQANVSFIKVLIWLGICAVFAYFGSMDMSLFHDAEFNRAAFTPNFLGGVVVTGLLIAGYGFARRNGDFLALLRENLTEMKMDDIAAIAHVMHKSVMAAANQVGIDTKKLEPRVPFYQQRTKPRI